MDNTRDGSGNGIDWANAFDNIPWDDLDDEPTDRDTLLAYFGSDGFDYKRSYIRKIMKDRPDVTDQFKVDVASEQMYESHTEGVELDTNDALRFVANDKPKSVEELVKMLSKAGVNDSNIFESIEKGIISHEDSPIGTIKNKSAKATAKILTSLAEYIGKNNDVIVLGLPTFDPIQNWTQVKLAFFSEDLSEREKTALQVLMEKADKSHWRIEHGVAVAVFQLVNIWDDFK
jgi:hypothetical protein